MSTLVQYHHHSEDGKVFMTTLQRLLQKKQISKVLEIGSGDLPMLSEELVHQYNLHYSVLDIDKEALENLESSTDYIHEFIVADASQLKELEPGSYNLILSKFTWEHIQYIEAFHNNINSLLTKDGYAMHHFPCVTSLPFFVNHLLPESLSAPLLNLLNERETDKYPAFYQWCFGPTTKNINRLKSTGFSVQEYHGYFGHSYYKSKLGLLHLLERVKTKILLRFSTPKLCSNGTVVLQKN